MLGILNLMDILQLKREGHSVRQIAEITGHSRNTVRKVLRGEHDGRRQTTLRASKLDPFKDYLRQRRGEVALSAVRLFDEIAAMGYDGSIITLRRFLATFEAETTRRKRLTVRFETPPGHQAQVDWAEVGKVLSGHDTSKNVYLFASVLSYSRMLFVHFTTSMKLPSLIDGHLRAFEFFGGWPREILYDNMKQVRIGPGKLNEGFLDFARHYGFTPKTHRPYRPRTKGKVERVIDYVQDNFLLGRPFESLDDLNAQSRIWLAQTANVRVHATTQERPSDLFGQELLTPIGSVPQYHFHVPVQRTVNFEAMVHFRGSRYSVPPEFARKSVFVDAFEGQIRIRQGDLVIAEHRQASRSGQCIVAKEHLEELWKILHQQLPTKKHQESLMRPDPEVQRVDLQHFEEVYS